MLDLLSEVLSRLNIKGMLYFRRAFTPPWGVEVPAYKKVARFHFALRGKCWVRVFGVTDPVALAQGDIIIIPHGTAHQLLSEDHLGADIVTMDKILSDTGHSGEGVQVHANTKDDGLNELICGHISFSGDTVHPVFHDLPPYIHMPNYGPTAGAWMEATLRVISEETGGIRAGGDLIALKLAETVFAHSIRVFLEGKASDEPGFSGFTDPKIARALQAFHLRPADHWSVAKLAKAAGRSRTGFAQDFATRMHMTPMQYVTYWRMQIAQQVLAQTKMSIPEIAEQVGYSSESAFARAFKKMVGITPSRYRTSQ